MVDLDQSRMATSYVAPEPILKAFLKTFVPEPFLETNALALRSEGRDSVRAAYEMQFFRAFPDLAPADEWGRRPSA
jgi:hypothetical protein